MPTHTHVTKCIRALQLEVGSADGNWTDMTTAWHALEKVSARAANVMVRTWLLWHHERDAWARLEAWYDARDAGKAADRCPVHPMPKELSRRLYREARRHCPSLNVRSLVLIQNTLVQTIIHRKPAEGRLPGWQRVLLCQENLPSWTKGYPILFDVNNAQLLPPGTDGHYRLRLRVLRVACDQGHAQSRCDVITLRSTNPRSKSAFAAERKTLARILDGVYLFKGSKLVYSKKKHKWFVHLSYQAPAAEPLPLDPAKTAVLYPQRRCPWQLRVPGGRRWPLGYGPFVAHQRRQLLIKRRSRQAQYKHAGHNAKGHGRRRACQGWWRLSTYWKDFTKRVNHSASRNAVNTCAALGIGRLVYVQPGGAFAASRFLATAGKIDGFRDPTGWDWYQLGVFLKQKCQEKGIALEIRKQPKPKSAEPTAA